MSEKMWYILLVCMFSSNSYFDSILLLLSFNLLVSECDCILFMRKRFITVEVRFKFCLHEKLPVYYVVNMKCKQGKSTIHVILKVNRKN
jgi:hypothetical protein